MLKTVMTIIASFWLMLVPAVVSGNTTQAQQTAATVQSENKDAGTPAADTIQSDSKAADTQAADTTAAETEKKYPVTEPVAGREDVVAFTDAGNGFRVYIPAELELYPLGVNPVAVLRGENAEQMKMNGTVVFLDRDLAELLPTDDRPLADNAEKICYGNALRVFADVIG